MSLDQWRSLWDSEETTTEKKEFSLIPKGSYDAVMTASLAFDKSTQWDPEPRDEISLEFALLDKEHKGRKLWKRYRKDIEDSKKAVQLVKLYKMLNFPPDALGDSEEDKAILADGISHLGEKLVKIGVTLYKGNDGTERNGVFLNEVVGDYVDMSSEEEEDDVGF